MGCQHSHEDTALNRTPLSWTPEMDRVLHSIAAEGVTTPVLAKMFTERTGIDISRDAAKNRLARLREQAERQGLTRYEPEGEAFFVPAAPTDEYVGLRIAFWDLETTGLGAFAGDLLCASIGDSWGRVESRTVHDFPRESSLDDSGLAEWVRDTLESYDCHVGWFTFGFDIGFLNARLLRWGKRPLRRMLAIDPIWRVRGGRYGIKLGTSKLKNAAIFFHTPNQKPEVEPEIWKRAERGDPEAMAILVERCESDVLVTRDVFKHVKPLIQTIHT